MKLNELCKQIQLSTVQETFRTLSNNELKEYAEFASMLLFDFTNAALRVLDTSV